MGDNRPEPNTQCMVLGCTRCVYDRFTWDAESCSGKHDVELWLCLIHQSDFLERENGLRRMLSKDYGKNVYKYDQRYRRLVLRYVLQGREKLNQDHSHEPIIDIESQWKEYEAEQDRRVELGRQKAKKRFQQDARKVARSTIWGYYRSNGLSYPRKTSIGINCQSGGNDFIQLNAARVFEYMKLDLGKLSQIFVKDPKIYYSLPKNNRLMQPTARSYEELGCCQAWDDEAWQALADLVGKEIHTIHWIGGVDNPACVGDKVFKSKK